MRKLKLDRILAAAIGILWLGATLEESPQVHAGQVPPPFDRKNVKTVGGTVDKVEPYTMDDGKVFTRVIFKTKDEKLDLLLGPTDYLDRNQLVLAEGDRLVVTGSEVAEGRTKYLLAQEVQKGDEIWILRNGQGVPLWSVQPPGDTAPANPVYGSAKPGYVLFTQQCAVCHNAYSTQTKIGPGLKGLFYRAKLVNGKAVNDADLREFLNTSHTGMPSFANTLSAKQIDELIAYLERL